MTPITELQMDYVQITMNTNPYSVLATLALWIISIQHSYSIKRYHTKLFYH